MIQIAGKRIYQGGRRRRNNVNMSETVKWYNNLRFKKEEEYNIEMNEGVGMSMPEDLETRTRAMMIEIGNDRFIQPLNLTYVEMNIRLDRFYQIICKDANNEYRSRVYDGHKEGRKESAYDLLKRIQEGIPDNPYVDLILNYG